MKTSRFLFLFIALLILYGCASEEHYKDCAAEAARDFLFKKIGYMSHENEAYIKYTYPKILVSPISPGAQYNQICFAWDLPSPKVTVLVYGASTSTFRGWFPARVLYKEYTEEEIASQHDTTMEPPGRLGKEEEETNSEQVPRRSHS